MRCVQCEKLVDEDSTLTVFGRPVCCLSCYSAEMQVVRNEQWELPLVYDFGGGHVLPP